MGWVVEEARTKKSVTIDPSTWTIHSRTPETTPQQLNGTDCGVFVIACADFKSDNLPLTYSQRDMDTLRLKIAADICRGHLLYPLI